MSLFQDEIHELRAEIDKLQTQLAASRTSRTQEVESLRNRIINMAAELTNKEERIDHILSEAERFKEQLAYVLKEWVHPDQLEEVKQILEKGAF